MGEPTVTTWDESGRHLTPLESATRGSYLTEVVSVPFFTWVREDGCEKLGTPDSNVPLRSLKTNENIQCVHTQRKGVLSFNPLDMTLDVGPDTEHTRIPRGR